MYSVKLMRRAFKDLEKLPKPQATKIFDNIQSLEKGLVGDIKKLTDFSPEYRLRIGNYRVFFEIEGRNINIYRVMHRKNSYMKR